MYVDFTKNSFQTYAYGFRFLVAKNFREKKKTLIIGQRQFFFSSDDTIIEMLTANIKNYLNKVYNLVALSSFTIFYYRYIYEFDKF